MTGAERTRRGRSVRLIVCLLVAVAIRVVWVSSIEVDPRSRFHFDMTWYDLAALNLLEGRVLTGSDGVATAFWPPGYPALLAAAYASFGASIRVAQGLNIALACLGCFFVYRLGQRIDMGVDRQSSPATTDARRTATGAAAILAVFPGYVFFAPLTLSENAFVALLAGLLLLFARIQASPTARPFPHWFGFGAWLGVAMLTRGAATLLWSVPVVLWWFDTRSARAVGLRAVALACGAAAIVLPWTIRNTVVMGAPVGVSTSVGMALLYAHSPVADGSESLRMVGHRREVLADLQSLPNPEREVREMQRGVEASLRYAVAHPLHELRLIPQRWFHLFQHDHAGLDWASADGEGAGGARWLVSESTDHALGLLANGFFWGVLGLAAIGGWRRRRDPVVQLLIATTAYFVLLHGVLFVGNPRYHAPLYPVLAVLAAIGVSAVLERAGPRSPDQSR